MKWKVNEDIQKKLVSGFTDEFSVAKRNNERINEDFEVYNNMIHSIREKKANAWESDIYMPEFVSRLLTQIGNFTQQYFGSPDFVETADESDDPKDVLEAKASKKLLNKILNDKDTHYYQKIVRLIMFVFSGGYGIIKGDYTQEIQEEFSHNVQKSDFITDDAGEYLAEDGTPYVDPTIQKPAFHTTEEPVYRNNIIKDLPTFDVYPVQNVYMSPEYAYTLNDKEMITFETEMTLSRLKDSPHPYFNLDLLEKEDPEGKRGEKTYNKDNPDEEQPDPQDKTFLILERWGRVWMSEKDGEYVPGIDKSGERRKDAKLVEGIVTFAQNRETDLPRHCIRFQKSPHTKRPMVRFLCYVDMLRDAGFGDGEMTAELQKAINDNYNLMNYRTKLAITPAFKGSRFSPGLSENVRITPEKVIMLDNMDDLQEFKIEDNIQGGVVHQNLLSSRMDYAMSTSPQTMGATPERAETATMASIVSQNATVRLGMKSMNLEFIGFTDFYDMLLTLCNDFMLPGTLDKLVGEELALSYNPQRKDKFKPVSQALETEESKMFKVKTYQSLMQTAAAVPNPKTPMVMNYVIGEILEALGGSFKHFKKFMFSEDEDANALYLIATGAKGGGSPPAGNPMAPAQNQGGLRQSGAEQNARGNM